MHVPTILFLTLIVELANKSRVIGASLSEPHINGTAVRNPYIYIIHIYIYIWYVGHPGPIENT